MSITKSNKSGFTLLELLIVIGILAILAIAIVLVLNPAEFMRQSRDAKRINDLEVINTAINLIMVNKGGTIDWDGPNFADSCYGQAYHTVYVSVPQGETPPTFLPAGWVWGQVSSDNLRKTDGSGWLPIDFEAGGAGIGVNLPVLPIDPINTFASGKFFSYVCDPELTTSFESEKFKKYMYIDNGDDADTYEIGDNRTITPVRPCDNYGDVDLDGVVNAYDADLVKSYLDNISSLNDEQMLRADVNNQLPNVNSVDVDLIRSYDAGTITTFPACKYTSPCGTYGDINDNKYVNKRDMMLVFAYDLSLITLTQDQKKRGDVNKDGFTNIGDAVVIGNYSKGSINTFAVCGQ
ncbi:MAG: dockerin type I domain-containing protein [bacterium]|nr:dockerin type I domain-containing protein [bacterium]